MQLTCTAVNSAHPAVSLSLAEGVLFSVFLAIVLLLPPRALALCGNGVLEPGECCDDGNLNNSDGCCNDCTVNVGGGCGHCPCVKPPADLVAWWPLDETAPPQALDIAGYSPMHPGNQWNTISFVPGVVGGAYHFSSNFFAWGLVRVFPNDPFIDVGTRDFTIDAWINPDLINDPFLLGRPRIMVSNRAQGLGAQNFGGSKGIWFYIEHPANSLSQARLGLLLAPDPFSTFPYQTASAPIVMGQWQHVAVTVARPPSPAAAVGKFYVNGAHIVGSDFTLDPSLVGISLDNNSVLDIGHGDTGYTGTCGFVNSYLNGAIDELEIFARALDPMEIQQIVAAGGAGKCKTPLDHLKCYLMTDTLNEQFLVDLDSPQFGLERGCKVVKATKFCVPVRKTVLEADLVPVSGQELLDDRICYLIQCTPPFPPNQRVQDQFGTRVITHLRPYELCTPAKKVPKCGNARREGTEECDDGNKSNGDGCSRTCTLEPQLCPPPCTTIGAPCGSCGTGTCQSQCSGAGLICATNTCVSTCNDTGCPGGVCTEGTPANANCTLTGQGACPQPNNGYCEALCP